MKKIEIYLQKNFSGFHFSLCCIKHADKKREIESWKFFLSRWNFKDHSLKFISFQE